MLVRATISLMLAFLLAGGAWAKLPAAPADPAKAAAEKEKADAAAKKDAADLAKAQDKTVANYKKNKGAKPAKK